MDAKALAVLATAAAGGLVAMQAPINSRLGREIGTFPAAALSFAIGLTLLVAIVVVAGGAKDVGGARTLPWYYLTGGILGAAYVSTVLVSVRTLGAGGVTAATIAGQLAASVAVDHFGLLNVTRQPVTLVRVLGIVLLAVGVLLIVRD